MIKNGNIMETPEGKQTPIPKKSQTSATLAHINCCSTLVLAHGLVILV